MEVVIRIIHIADVKRRYLLNEENVCRCICICKCVCGSVGEW